MQIGTSTPAYRARDTIALLCRETPDFISPDQWPPNSPDMCPFDYEIWAVMQTAGLREMHK